VTPGLQPARTRAFLDLSRFYLTRLKRPVSEDERVETGETVGPGHSDGLAVRGAPSDALVRHNADMRRL